MGGSLYRGCMRMVKPLIYPSNVGWFVLYKVNRRASEVCVVSFPTLK